jgi:ABC-type polysaccharide/polyol phosphate transport system ATPase subunit
MLKMLNGIFMPDKGQIEIKGRVGALIEVGAGFHPMLTGRENIYVNGAILGMSKKEIDRKFDDIVDFADIGDFIDAPVKHFSSGMQVRLGFSIAANVMPEILLIDEVLSVGDINFQNKGLRRLSEIREKASAVIFVSHNLEHVQNLCQKVMVLNNGRAVFFGNTEKALLKYHEISREARMLSMKKENRQFEGTGGYSTGEIKLVDYGLLDDRGGKTNKINLGDDLNLFFDFKVNKQIDNPVFSIGIRDEKGNNCIWHKSNEVMNIPLNKLDANCLYRIKVRFASPSLNPGVYIPVLGLMNYTTAERYEKIINLNSFIIDGEMIPRGIVNCKSDWELKQV